MDPVTHLSSGVLGALAARRWFPEARFFIPFCMLAAWIPDGDIFFGNSDPEFNLLYHRGITTSFFGTIFLALGVAGLFKLVSRSSSFPKSALLFYCLCLTHVWLDVITTYGTQLLAPFSNHRFALDGAFIIDPVLTGVAIGFAIPALIVRRHRHKLALLGMAWLIIYPLTNMGIGAYLQTAYAERLNAEGVAFDHVHVTPDALAPRYWKVVTTAGPDYLLDTIDLLDGELPISRQRFKRANKSELEALGEQESMFATYAWFSKWPYVQENTLPAGKQLIFHDLRFTSTNPVLIPIFKDRPRPFTLTAVLDENGTLTNWTYERGASSVRTKD